MSMHTLFSFSFWEKKICLPCTTEPSTKWLHHLPSHLKLPGGSYMGVSHHPTTHTLLWEPTWNIFAADAHGALSQNWLDTWKNRKYCTTFFLKSNVILNARLSKPFGKKRRKTIHKFWKEIWLFPHCLTQPSQLLSRLESWDEVSVVTLLTPPTAVGKPWIYPPRKSKVGRSEETWVCGSGGWGIHSKSCLLCVQLSLLNCGCGKYDSWIAYVLTVTSRKLNGCN